MSTEDLAERKRRADARAKARAAKADTGKPKTLQELLKEGAGANRAAAAGIKCPKCGCPDSSVDYTRRRPGKVVRRRVCDHCDARFPTFETA